MVESYDENEFEIADKYDALTEMYEAEVREHEENPYRYCADGEDEDDFDPEELHREMFGDLKRGDEYILMRYKGSAENVTVPNGLAGIKAEAFAGNTTVKTVVCPDSLLRIATGAFRGCTALTEVRLNKNLTAISLEAFKRCSALKSIEIPDGVTVLGDRAFEGCTALSSVRLSKGLRAISRELFKNCTALGSIDIPDGVEVIRINAFEGCKALERVEFGDGIRGIGWNAFQDCKSLKSLRLPPLLEDIDMFLFMNSGLEELFIPKSVEMISNDAFAYCEKLTRVEVDPENPCYYSRDNCLFDKRDNELLFGGNAGTLPIDGRAAVIGDHAFSGNLRVRELRLPEGIKKIGAVAFSKCKRLCRVEFPASLEKIGYRAFEGCTALEEITVPGGVKVLEACAFKNCGLKCVVVKRGVQEIEASAFANNPELCEVYIPSTVTEFGVSVFEQCSKELCVYFETNDETACEDIKYIRQKHKVVLGCQSDIFDR